MPNNILDELINHSLERTKKNVIENKAKNIIHSAINLMTFLENNLSKEDFEKIQKKFFLAVKNKDANKFLSKLKNLDIK